MARREGPQNIPPALFDLYRATLNPNSSANIVKTRYPFQMPLMQEGGPGVSVAQIVQRDRFKTAVANFANVSEAERQRWYAAAPEWSSFLWYYNYYIMSDLAGNADWKGGGFGVIKTIQFVKDSVPVAGNKSFTINTVDPAKTVVMMFGNSFISDKVQRGASSVAYNGSVNIALSPNVEIDIAEVKLQGETGISDVAEGTGDGLWGAPRVTALTVNQLTVAITMTNWSGTCYFSWEIIEHKAQTIFPVIDSIAATAVIISWAKTPSVAADITLIVIEYI